MEGRSALIAAIVSGALAVVIVAVDLQFGLEAELQALEDGEWVTVSDDDPRVARPFGADCPGQDFRIVVHNGGLFATTMFVYASYGGSFGSETVLSEDWMLERGETRQFEFRIPDSAWEGSSDNDTEMRHLDDTVRVSAEVGQIYLNACAMQEAME